MVSRYVEHEQTMERVAEYIKKYASALLPEEDEIRELAPHPTPELFLSTSLISVGHMLHFTDLTRDANIFDFGCGAGRLAIPMSGYLSESGTYFGVDIQKKRVDGCKKRFASFPNFQFAHFNQKEALYNPNGITDFQKLKSDLPSNCFDVTTLFSVFTHVLPDTIEQLFDLIHGCLSEGGTMLVSFFLLNSRTYGAATQGGASIQFAHQYGVARVNNPATPEHAVAYEESYIFDALRNAGFQIELISYGSWSNTMKFPFNWQDLVVCTRV